MAKVVFVDIGQGAAIIIQLPDAVILNDVGRNSKASADAIKAQLNQLGVTEITAIIISNPDADHAGGCDDLYAAYPVKALYHQGSAKDTQTWASCLAGAQAEGTPVYTDDQLNPGDYLNLSQTATLRVLNINAHGEDINSGSISLRLDYGDFSIMLPGDIQCDEEDDIIAKGWALDVDYLQLAHHGSATSTCNPWLQATTPLAAFIPVGANNQYGHPTNATLDRLAAVDAQIYRTDLNGTITVATDGHNVQIATTKP